jgi:hypothetical protein
MPNPNMYGLSIWKSKSESMEKQADKGQTSQDGTQARRHYLSRPDEFVNARTGGPNQWHADQRYKCATVFVDQGSRLGYVYPQKTSSAEETIEAKNQGNPRGSQNHADTGQPAMEIVRQCTPVAVRSKNGM